MKLGFFITLASFCTLSLESLEAKLPRDYQNKTGQEKQNILMNNASLSPYSASAIKSQKNPDALSMLKLFSTTYLAKSFTLASDEFETKKTKLIHTYGAVAKVNFRITRETKYTGLFKSGAPGIIRFSLAQLGGSYTPGLALKLLVDGEKSQNIFAMHSLEGQGNNYNFFANDFESKIAEPVSNNLKLLGQRFKLAIIELGSSHGDPTLQSATDLAEVTTKGEVVNKPLSPYSLIFEANTKAQMSSEMGDLRLRLQQAPYLPGLVLYKVFVRAFENAPKEELGEVILESVFVASEYGDTQLFFQHNID